MESQNNEHLPILRSIRRDAEWISAALIILCAVGFRSCYNEGRIADSLESRNKQEIQVRDVLGNEQPEMFYDVNAQRAYLEIDGRPVGSYFPQKPIPGGI